MNWGDHMAKEKPAKEFVVTFERRTIYTVTAKETSAKALRAYIASYGVELFPIDTNSQIGLDSFRIVKVEQIS